MSYAVRKEKYEYLHYKGLDQLSELVDFVGDQGSVMDYLTGNLDIYFYNLGSTGATLRVHVGDYIIKSENSWGAYPAEEFHQLFEIKDKVVPFKKVVDNRYIIGRKGTVEYPNYDLDSVTSDFRTLEEQVKKGGYEFLFQDDGGFLYEHKKTKEPLWISHIHL